MNPLLVRIVRFWTQVLTGDWKVARTRRQECLRYVAQAFQPAGSGDILVPQFQKLKPHPLLITPGGEGDRGHVPVERQHGAVAAAWHVLIPVWCVWLQLL